MSLNFDGINDQVAVGDVAAIDITGTALTVSCWFWWTGAITDFLIGKRQSGVAIQYGMYLDLSPAKLRFEVADGGTVPNTASTATTVTTGVWHHGAGRLNGAGGGGTTVWLDGVNDGSATGVTLGNTTNSLTFGAASNGSFRYTGQIAEVSIWNVALSDGEMVSLAKGVSPYLIRRNSLAGYWPLWSSAHAMDLSGNGNAGTITEAVTAAHVPVMPLLAFEDESPYRVAVAAGVQGGMTLLRSG